MHKDLSIQKVCSYCGAVFTAYKTTTRYCSHACNSKAYKANKRNKLVGEELKKTKQLIAESKVDHLKQKLFLNVSDAALFICVSRPTIYSYIKNKELNPMQVGNRILISVDEIYDKFNTFNLDYFKPTQNKSPILEWYTIEEIKQKYNVKESWIFKIIREQNVPKVKMRKIGYYSKKHIDDYFKENQPDDNITEWYSVEDIQNLFGMTLNAVYTFVYENNVPKKRDGRKSFYSKHHVDVAKGISEPDEVLYYTVLEAMKKYNLTRDALYHYIKYHP